MTAAFDVDIVPLDVTSWPSLAKLFEQGGDPANCWCTFWRLTNAESKAMTREGNRAWLEAGASAADRLPIGLVAMVDSAAVGWVSLAPRDKFHRLAASRTLPTIDGDAVWSITCFVVGRAMRGRGMSSALLDSAVTFASRHGAKVVEAYPVATDSDRIHSASAYTGVESTFLAAGFTRIAETASRASGQARVVVRRTL